MSVTIATVLCQKIDRVQVNLHMNSPFTLSVSQREENNRCVLMYVFQGCKY